MTARPKSPLVRIGTAGLALALALVLPVSARAQGAPHAALLQAYRQSVAYLTTTLQQANRQAAIDATVTVIAVHRALTAAIADDVARARAAARTLDAGEGTALTKVTDAEIERTTHIMFAGNWIGAGNASARQAALDGAPVAITATEAALAGLAPVLQRVQAATPLPPALVLGATVSRQANGSFLIAVTVRNAGGVAAGGTTLGITADGAQSPSQVAQLGAIAPGATLQHVFVVALPATAPKGTVSLSVEAANATSTVTLVDLE